MFLTLCLIVIQNKILILTVNNILGEVIINETLRSFSGNYSSRINMSQYPNAIYILKLTTNNGMINRKLTLE